MFRTHCDDSDSNFGRAVDIQDLSKRFEHLLLWPPRSPDLTPCDFFYGDTLKTMSANHKLQDRIRAAVQTIDGNKLAVSRS